MNLFLTALLLAAQCVSLDAFSRFAMSPLSCPHSSDCSRFNRQRAQQFLLSRCVRGTARRRTLIFASEQNALDLAKQSREGEVEADGSDSQHAVFLTSQERSAAPVIVRDASTLLLEMDKNKSGGSGGVPAIRSRFHEFETPESEDEREQWRQSWRHAKPQQTLYLQGHPRDRWIPMRIPLNLNELFNLLDEPSVARALKDPQQRNYWIYHTGRTLFFFLSNVLAALLQMKVEPDWRPWVYGKNYRRELAAALKRIAMSGEKKSSGEFKSATKIPSAERVSDALSVT